MNINFNSGYGGVVADAVLSRNPTMGKTFVVVASTDPSFQFLSELFVPDTDGLVRVYATITAALAACTAGHSDKVIISPNFNTAPTLAELASCGTKGVAMEVLGNMVGDGYVAQKAATTLPASVSGNLFTITASVKVSDIVGEVTTTIQTQADTANLILIPTVGATVNLCAGLDITGLVTGSVLSITGTLANAMLASLNGVFIGQATPLVLPAGKLALNCTAINTGAIKWTVRYQPLAPGSYVF